MAASYTDVLTYKVRTTSGTNAAQELTITDNGDNTYNVVLTNLNTTSVLALNVGELTFSNVAGTTVDGVTTISTKTTPAVSQTADIKGASEGDLTLKFNDSKAYLYYTGNISYLGFMTYSLELTYGTDEGFSGGGTVDPGTFEPTTNDYHADAYVDYNGTQTDIEGGADVAVTEYEEGKYSVTFKSFTDGESIYGNLTVNNLTATTSEEGTKYELTDESVATWSGVTPVGIMSGISENDVATISDFFCATGTLAGNENNVALSFKVSVAGSDITVYFGEQAPKATEYTGTWNVTRKGYTTSESTENAVVSILLKDEGTAQVTIPAFADLDEDYPGTVAPLTFDVNYAEALDGEVRYVKFFGSNDDLEIGEGDWNGYSASVSVDGKLVDGVLTATFNVVLGGMEEYTYELGFNVMPFVAHAETYSDVANITFGGNTVDFDEASVEVTEYEKDKYSLIYKSLTLNGNEVGDFTISNVTIGENNALSTTATTGVWTRTVENNAAGVDAGDEAEIRNFEGTYTLGEGEESAKFVVKFGVNVQGEWADVVFGEKTTPVEPVDDYAINFDKDGQNNHAERRTSSVSLQQEGKDEQTLTFNSSLNGYEDHSADKEFTVEAGSEVATTFDYNGSWMHGYVYIDLDNNKQFDVNADDLANSPELVAYSYYNGYNSKGEVTANNCNVTPPTFTAPATPGTYRIRFKIDWDNVDPGGCVDSGNHILNNGGGVWDATLVVTEPVVDGINAINAAVAEGNAEIFTINGAKANKLQKGVNLVRTADGKVKKVLVK